MYLWGRGSNGELGNGTFNTEQSTPLKINCPTILAVDEIEKSKLFIYPNPTKDFISVKSYKNESFAYQIFDISGKLVLKGKAKSDDKINVQCLEKGSYIFWIEIGEKVSVGFIKD